MWGNDAQDHKVLIAMELQPESNNVSFWTFPEATVTEEFSKQMLNQWRIGSGTVAFPEGFTQFDRELTVSESILPDGLRVERSDFVQRAQTEWHFIVLSSKLNQAYQSEIQDLRDKVEKLERYDNGLWDQLKAFWDKVQDQVRDRNLFREQADALRDAINEQFGRLKELRAALDQEYHKVSGSHLDVFMASLLEIEERIAKGIRLQGLFDELKELQRKFRDLPFTRDHRAQVWERLDAAFKNVKERRFGPANANSNHSNSAENASPTDRMQRRMEGLMSAIDKMQYSIDRDKDDLNFQKRKIATTDGQLEAQIRQAKIMMIDERVRSKEEKLAEMVATKVDLEAKIASLTDRDAKRIDREKAEAAKEATKEAAKKAAQEKIAAEMQQAAEARKGDEKLEKAASMLAADPAAKIEKVIESQPTPAPAAPATAEVPPLTVAEKVEDAIEDATDTVKAIAMVVSNKVTEFVDSLGADKADETEIKS